MHKEVRLKPDTTGKNTRLKRNDAVTELTHNLTAPVSDTATKTREIETHPPPRSIVGHFHSSPENTAET